MQRDNNLTTFRLFKDLFTQREYLSRWFQEQSLVISKIKKFFYLNILTDFESKVDLLIFDKRVRWNFFVIYCWNFPHELMMKPPANAPLKYVFVIVQIKYFLRSTESGTSLKLFSHLNLRPPGVNASHLYEKVTFVASLPANYSEKLIWIIFCGVFAQP